MEEFEKRWKELDERKDKEAERKLAQLEEEFPLQDRILAISEMKARERLEQDIKELNEYERGLTKYKTLTLAEIYNTEFPEEEWIVDRLIPEEGIVGCVGDSGSYKSLFTQYLVKCLLSKEPVFGQFEVKKDCNILFIDKENRLRRTKKRLQAFGVPSTDRIRYIAGSESFDLSNAEFNKFITDEVRKYKINLIIIDSFVDVYEDNENDPNQTRKAFDKLRQLVPNGTIIVIHHSSKPIPNYRRSVLHQTRGSTNIAAQFETQLFFSLTGNNKIFTIEQGKARDSEKLQRFGVEIVYEQNGPITDLIYKGEIEDDLGLLDEVVNKIVEIVAEQPGIDRDSLEKCLKSEIGCKSKTVQNGLSEAKKRNLITTGRKPGLGNQLFYYPIEEQEGVESDE